jgi:cobalt-zinc-cadmium efflux system outer membrane protein
LLAFAWLSAAAAAEAPRMVTLEQAVAAAGEAPAQRAAAQRTAAAAAGVEAAGAWPATVVGVATATATAREIVTLTVPLPVFGTLRADRAVAEADAGSARVEAAASALTLRHDIQAAWIGLAAAEARAERAEKTAEREEQLAAATRERFAAGDASRFDEVQAEAAAKRARADAGADRAAVAGASAALAGLLGWDLQAVLHADGGLPPLADPPPLPALLARAEAHPDVLVPEARARAEQARVEQAARSRWPVLALDFEADLNDPTLPGNDFRVGPSLELPLLGRGAEREAAAEASRDAALAERDRARREVEARIAQAFGRYQAAAGRARSLESDVLPVQREAADLARLAWREGQAGLVSVLEAERSLLEAEQSWVDAVTEAAQARVDLVAAVGGSL